MAFLAPDKEGLRKGDPLIGNIYSIDSVKANLFTVDIKKAQCFISYVADPQSCHQTIHSKDQRVWKQHREHVDNICLANK